MFILAMTGCGNSQTITSSSGVSSSLVTSATASSKIAETSSSQTTKFNVDWDKCLKDTKANITGKAYPYVKDVYAKVAEKEKLITFTAVLDDSTDPQKALNYADTMLRQYNLFASQQDSNISLGDKESFGGLYDAYNVSIGIAPQSQTNNQSKWFVYDAIGKGTQTKHTIKLQKAYK